MKGILKILLFILLPYIGWSQKYDGINIKKNIADLRSSNFPDTIVAKWQSTLITKADDTLKRYYQRRYISGVGVLIQEINTVNGKVNGVSVNYHQNGSVFSMMYYLDNKPWEAMYLADSSGHRYFPGTLANGCGIENRIDVAGRDLGFVTYKNGNMDGEFSQISGGVAKQGRFLYQAEFIKSDTITLINFINNNNDTLSAFLFNDKGDDSISIDFLKLKKGTRIKILKETQIIDSPGKENMDLNIFLNAGVVPVGEWRWFNIKENKTYVAFKFSNVGKLERWTSYALNLVREFNENGSMRSEYKIPD